MCLKKEFLNFEWSDTDEFYVGTGYKALYEYAPKKFSLYCGLAKLGVWHDASKLARLQDKKVYYNHYPTYPLGFHIFLSPLHAKQYGGDEVYEVQYYNVLGFGRQNTTEKGTGECVIAQKMKIVRKLSKEEIVSISRVVKNRCK